MLDYNAIKVTGSWATPLGTIDILDGRIDGKFADPTTDNDRWELKSDGQGNTIRYKRNSRTGRLAITVAYGSLTNSQLSTAAKTDDIAENIRGLLQLHDVATGTRVVMEDAFLVAEPPPSFGTAQDDLTWVFACERMAVHHGGVQ